MIKKKFEKNPRELWYESFVLDIFIILYNHSFFFITYFLCFLIIFSFTNLMTLFCINNNI